MFSGIEKCHIALSAWPPCILASKVALDGGTKASGAIGIALRHKTGPNIALDWYLWPSSLGGAI